MLKRAKKGERVQALQDFTAVWPHLQHVMDAFWDLCADRGGDGSGPMLFASIDAYAKRYRIGDRDPEEFRAFSTMLRAMDAVWLKDVKRRRKEQSVDESNRRKVRSAAKQSGQSRSGEE